MKLIKVARNAAARLEDVHFIDNTFEDINAGNAEHPISINQYAIATLYNVTFENNTLKCSDNESYQDALWTLRPNYNTVFASVSFINKYVV